MQRTVRKYTPDDLDDVLSVWGSATRLAHPFLTEKFLEEERYNIPNVYLPNAETWILEQDNQVIGFVALIGVEVGALFVDPRYHRSGAGRALMDKARELRNHLEVDVFKDNQIGRPFYARYGFEIDKEYVHGATGNMLLRMRFAGEPGSTASEPAPGHQ